MNREVILSRVLPWTGQWIAHPYQLPVTVQFYPETSVFLKKFCHVIYLYLKAYAKEIRLPILLHLSAVFTLHFHGSIPLFFISLPLYSCMPVLPFVSSFFISYASSLSVNKSDRNHICLPSGMPSVSHSHVRCVEIFTTQREGVSAEVT